MPSPVDTMPASVADTSREIAGDGRKPTTLVRDLITVAVFTVLYFAIMAVVGQLGSLIPIGQVLGPFYIPIICGVPFMIFLTRVQRFGLITAMGVIVGLLFLLTGMSVVATILGVLLGALADLVALAGHYRRWPLLVASYVVFAEMGVGMVVPLFFQREAVLGGMATRHNTEWINQIAQLTPPWMFYVMLVMLAVGAIIGAFVGRAVWRKHFAYLAPAGQK